MTRRACVYLALGLLLVATAATDAVAAVTWYEHYQQGLAFETQERWQEAAREFQTAAQIERAPRRRILTYGRNYIFDYDPHFHLARCLVELGRFREASLHLAASRLAGVTPPQQLRPLAERIDEGLRPRQTAPQPSGAGHLIVRSDPPGARVTVDGIERGTTPLGPLVLAAQAHEIRVEAVGFVAEERRAVLSPGATYECDVALRPVTTQPTAVIGVVSTQAPPVEPQSSPPPKPSAVPATAPALPTPTEAVAPPLDAAAVATPLATPRVATLEFPAERQIPSWVPLAVLGGVLGVALATLALWRRGKATATAPTRSIEASATLVEHEGTIAQYELTGLLGRGGMATTYQARRQRDGSMVALKVPHDGCLADPTFVARFLREGRLGEQLHHPGIVRIFEAGEAGGRPFLAMELLRGKTLKELLRTEAPLPLRRAIEVARDVAEALDYAHVKGVIHRDLKPENIMVLGDGSLKVMDFGIARVEGQAGLTSSQFFLGTPLYAAPEMIDPRRIDHRVDLYALGIVLFEMLEGTVPFSADSPYRVLEMHLHQPLPNRDELPHPVPARVWSLIERLCAKEPAARFPSAELLLVELQAMLQDTTLVGLRSV